MGNRLREIGIHPDLLLSSPAERALSTCLIISEKVRYPLTEIRTDQRLYHASEDALLSIVHGLGDANHGTMIFGHNPGLTDFANGLSREVITDNIPTCGVVALKFPVHTWKEVAWKKGALLFFDFPKNQR